MDANEQMQMKLGAHGPGAAVARRVQPAPTALPAVQTATEISNIDTADRLRCARGNAEELEGWAHDDLAELTKFTAVISKLLSDGEAKAAAAVAAAEERQARIDAFVQRQAELAAERERRRAAARREGLHRSRELREQQQQLALRADQAGSESEELEEVPLTSTSESDMDDDAPDGPGGSPSPSPGPPIVRLRHLAPEAPRARAPSASTILLQGLRREYGEGGGEGL